jgi:uncharacterized membrane protein
MNSKEIRSNARKSLKGHWGTAIVAAIIANVFPGVGYSSSFSSDDMDFTKLSELSGTELITTLAIFGGILLIGLAISLVVSSVISIGYAQFNMDLVDGDDPKISTLFSKVRQLKTAVIANILVFVRVFFGMIFFIVPGVIALFKYSMTNYIIAENPGISAREALDKSKKIMKGNKLRFFLLGLSFIGWEILVVLTFGIAGIWVSPYMQASYAEFYREIE